MVGWVMVKGILGIGETIEREGEVLGMVEDAWEEDSDEFSIDASHYALIPI